MIRRPGGLKVPSISLDGIWSLRYAAPGEGERRGWPTLGVAGGDAIAASVPGDIHTALVTAGLIEEPLKGRNTDACRWAEERDWWYSRVVDMPPGFRGDEVRLRFGGLDTTADVWLNGSRVGYHNNMFVPCEFDVTDIVREGPNLLVIRVDPGLRAVAGRPLAPYDRMEAGGTDSPRMWIRKAQFSFGWDWAPRLVTCGIWRSVELVSARTVALRDTTLRTTLLPDGTATVNAAVELELLTTLPVAATVSVVLSRDREYRGELACVLTRGDQTIDLQLVVPDPDLWWPAPLGEPHLYECRVAVEVSGESVAGTGFRYGLREVELLESPLADGDTSFTLSINGHQTYCKGANWVPADSLIARASPTTYRELIRLAADANFNMLRVWGGGVYEDDSFYDLCDEFGILVWQDFAYACSYYPDDDAEFLSEARREADLVIRRLRNHPSVVLWCGNNENQWIHHTLETQGRAADQFYGEVIYDDVLADLCRRLDPSRPYRPSSPFGGDDPNSEARGNHHAWESTILRPPEEGVDYLGYARDPGKFITEFGILAPPVVESLREFLSAEDLIPGSPGWEHHNNTFERGTVDIGLRRYWGDPPEGLDLETFVLRAQMIQAYGLTAAIEHWRRRKFETSGALLWMYSDCWGASTGWSIVDYYLRPKPSYHHVRRAFAPVLASIAGRGGRLELWITNDTLHEVTGRLEYGIADLRTGRVERLDTGVIVAANSSRAVAQLEGPGRAAPDWLAFCRLRDDDGTLIGHNSHLPIGLHLGDLDVSPTALEVTPLDTGLLIHAPTFAWQVHIEAPRPLRVEDDYFDLLPGESRSIRIDGPRELIGQAAVRALNDSPVARPRPTATIAVGE